MGEFDKHSLFKLLLYHYYCYNHFTGPWTLSGTTWWSGTRKVKSGR